MRLFLLSALTMTAFAANSILNRLAVDSAAIDAASFAAVRVLAGAVVLGGLVALRGGSLSLRSPRRAVGALALVAYMVGFSSAYVTLDAGLGALVLFGVVQITMFVLAALRGAPPTLAQLVGAGIAFAGLIWVLWPTGDAAVAPGGVMFMTVAGVGWAIYTLAGRSEPDALAGTAANFIVALPLVVLAVPLSSGDLVLSPMGVLLAVVSGAVTSGLGYSLWYRIVPLFTPSAAAIVQLSVPVIALVAGVVLLGEVASVRLGLGAALVLGGIALAVLSGRRRAARV